MNFLGLKDLANYDKAKAAIVSVPYEGTVTYGKGTAKGPKAILQASTQIELFDEELLLEPDININTQDPIKPKEKPEDVVQQVKETVSEILSDNKFPVTLGGEHSISLGPVLAAKEKYPNVTVLQFDAHADLRDSYEDSKYNHACVSRRIIEHTPLVQVGVRSLDDENYGVIKEKNIPVFWAKDIHSDNWHEEALSKLGNDVYITFDLDAFDPSIMPAIGTPEPGGLRWYQTINFLKKVFKEKNIVGFDVVELAPIKGLTYPDFLAARLVYKMITYKFYSQKLK